MSTKAVLRSGADGGGRHPRRNLPGVAVQALPQQAGPAGRRVPAGGRRAARRDPTRPDPHVPFTDQLLAGLDTHFDYFAANRHAVLAANRTLAGDPTIQAIINDELAVLRQRMVDLSGLDGHARDVLASVLTGWLVLVRVLVVDWLTNQTFSRTELRDICVGALMGALGDRAPRIERTPRPRQRGAKVDPAS